jgi:hypothetical protein
MTERVVQKLDLSRKLLLGAAGFASLAIPVAFGLVHTAQFQSEDTAAKMDVNSPSPFGKPATTNKDTAVDLPPFAVATIKPVAVADSDPSSMRFSDDGVSFRAVFVAWIVSQAFSAQPAISREDDRILGLPSWTKSERHDVEAKVDDEDVPKWKALSLSQQGLALQSLLVRRLIYSSITKLASVRPILWWLRRMARNSTRHNLAKPTQVVLAAPTARVIGTNRR